MAAFYLDSVAIGNLMSVDTNSRVALLMPGLVAELMCSRGWDESTMATSFAQLHLGEKLQPEENNISFDFMSTYLSGGSRDVLDNVADLFSRHPKATGRVETHAQPGAPPSVAKSICRARAEAVCSALEERGVPSSRLRCGGFGTLRPLLGASDGANRRAEIFMMLGGMQFPASHMPVRVDNSARFTAWLRGEASATVHTDRAPIVIMADSDDESSQDEEREADRARILRERARLLETSSSDGSDSSDTASEEGEVDGNTSD
jgi:outer membrane protein OmpA-like peptidoglycan-associated protein